MKLVFIHGRAQEGRSSEELRQQWLPGLQKGLQAAGIQIDIPEPILIPFYGDELIRLTDQSANYSAEIVTRGHSDVQVDEVTRAIILRMAERAGIDPNKVFEEQELTVRERGPTSWEWVQALARRLESRYPWLANQVLGQFTRDAKAYVDFEHIQQAVHDIVEPAVSDGPCVIVSHSLGTIVAYWTLTERAPNVEVPLLLTAGSPLGLDVFKDRLPMPLKIPSGVRRWLNVSDEEDVVALYAALDQSTFLPGIENLTDIENGDEPHAIERYLADPRVATAIATALQA